MRYAELLKQAVKHPSLSKEDARKLENALNSINAECDKFSHHIHNAPNISLIREITRHCTKEIFETIRQNRQPEHKILIRMIVRHEQQGLCAALNEIIKEKSREYDVKNIPYNSDNHVPKMYSAYRELSMFLHEILEPLKAKEEPCRLASDRAHIWLEYEQDFKNRDEDVNKKIEIERDISLRYASWQIMNPMEDCSLCVSPTYTDPFKELKLKSLQYRAPWVFEKIENFPLYAKETSGLSSILASLDVHYSRDFCEPFIEISFAENFKNVGSVYREIKNLSGENPLCNEIPIFIYAKDDIYTVIGFILPEPELRYHFDNLILDLDNLQADDEKNLNCLYTPIFKTKENGYEQYIIIPWLLFELEYEKTIYRHALKHTEEESYDDKLRGAVSRKMGKKIISYFSEFPGVIAKNFPNISIGGKDTDFDALLIEEQSNTAILIEYKHSMEFRRSPADAAKLLKNLLNYAAKQLKKQLEFIADHPRELEEKLNLPSMILSHVKFLPLIVCNSIEYDRKNFPFKEKVTVNGDVFADALKISLFELKHAIFQARDESSPLQTIIEAIQKDMFWQNQFSRRGFTRSPSRTTGLKVLYNFAKGSRNKI